MGAARAARATLTIHVAVSDAGGNSGTVSFQVEVPHNKKATATDDGPVYSVSGCSS